MSLNQISKSTVKYYLEYEGKEVGEKMKTNIEKKENWKEFKNEFSICVANYAKVPSQKNKQKMKDLISANFITNLLIGEEALEKVLTDLGIRDLELVSDEVDNNNKPKKEFKKDEYVREIYEDLGFETPEEISNRIDKEYQEEQDEKYGIFRKNKSLNKSNDSNDEKENKKEDNAIKKLLKKAYFKITASVLMAPGEVPPEILAENKELFKKASSKLDKLIVELKRAEDIVSKQNKASLENVPEDIQDIYNQMLDGELEDGKLDNFLETLEEKNNEQISSMRSNFEKLQKQKLEETLRSLAEGKELSKQELEDEIQYVMLDSKINDNEEVVLPEHSIFKEIFDENSTNEKAEEVNKAKSMISTYIDTIKIDDLSDEEIVKLSRNFRVLCKNFKDMNVSSKEYVIAESLSNKELLPENADDIMDEITNVSKEQIAVERITDETTIRYKINIAEEIQEQFKDIDDIIEKYNAKEEQEGSLNKTEAQKRAIALKIARVKVNSLEKAGLSKVISESDKKTKGLLKRAKSILTPELENAKGKGSRRFEKEFGEELEENEIGE